MEGEPVCVAPPAPLALDHGHKNAQVTPGDAAHLDHFFAPVERSSIATNFSTPLPKRRHAHLRVTTTEHLNGDSTHVAEGRRLLLRADSLPLYEFSLLQFLTIGWNVVCASHDDHAVQQDQPTTANEQGLTQQRATVHAVYARPAPEPASTDGLQTARDQPQSLIDYLPEDLFAQVTSPYGLSYAIDDYRNHRRHYPARDLAATRYITPTYELAPGRDTTPASGYA